MTTTAGRDTVHDEGRYRLLVNAITDYAIYMLDRDGHVVSWNAGAERFKGYTPTEIVGRPRFMCRDPFGNLVELTQLPA